MATYNNVSPLHRIKHLVFSEKEDILLLLILTLTYGLLGVATPVAVQAMVNMVTHGWRVTATVYHWFYFILLVGVVWCHLLDGNLYC